jgi:hypothetical protein
MYICLHFSCFQILGQGNNCHRYYPLPNCQHCSMCCPIILEYLFLCFLSRSLYRLLPIWGDSVKVCTENTKQNTGSEEQLILETKIYSQEMSCILRTPAFRYIVHNSYDPDQSSPVTYVPCSKDTFIYTSQIPSWSRPFKFDDWNLGTSLTKSDKFREAS